MPPILLISKDSQATEKYLQDFIKSGQFVPYRIFRYLPDPNVIKIDHIREIKSLLVRAETEKKLIIIYSFDTAKTETQNAFLKTLEEKINNVQFILLVGDETQVLSTIQSRCKVVNLKSSSAPKAFKSINFARSFPQLLADYGNMNKEKAINVCDQFLWYFKRLLVKDSLYPRIVFIKIIKEIIKVRNLIFKNNLNPQTAIDHLLIFINNCYNDFNDYKGDKKNRVYPH